MPAEFIHPMSHHPVRKSVTLLMPGNGVPPVRGLSWVCLALTVWLCCASTSAFAEVDFAHQIVPMLRKHCIECHSGTKISGGLSLNDQAAFLQGSENGRIVDFAQPDQSLMLHVVTTDDADFRMPPKGPGLTKEEAALLRQWIKEKAPWEPGFAFTKPAYEPPLKPRKVELPPIVNGRAHPIDRLVDAAFASRQIERPAAISDGEFLRRASLDLIGLLPTPEEYAAFMADHHPDKRTRLIQSLLNRDVDYTEHWLSFWNDLLRNDYSGTGFITGGRKQISRWLYESLLNNLPYDQLASELIAPPSVESRGYIDGITWRGTVSAGQTVEIQFAQSVGQSFLGINLKCASCHDSFVDRWKLDEAYGLAAIYSTRPLEIHRCDKPTGRMAKAYWPFPELGQVDPAAPRDERLKQLASLMTHPENGRFTRTIVNRLWHRLMGRGIVHPLDAMQSEPENADLLDYLANHLQEHQYDLKQTLEFIATSEIYQAKAESVAEESLQASFRGPRARRLSAEQFVDAVWQLTGTAPRKPDANVVRGKLDPALLEATAQAMSAEWIWGDSALDGKSPPANETLAFRTTIDLLEMPHKAAVIISCDNEYTMYLNGKKLGEGKNWEILGGYSLTSALKTNQPNELLVVGKNAGAGNNPAGLFVEVQIVQKDGRLKHFGSSPAWEWSRKLPDAKGKYAEQPTDWKPAVKVPALDVWTQRTLQPAINRLVELNFDQDHMVRSSLVKSDFLMRSLGRPNRDQIVSMRPNELTTLEAIDLSNGQTLATALDQGARSLLEKDFATTPELVNWVYCYALSRPPTETELATTVAALGDEPTRENVADLLWAILMQPEFFYVN